MKRGKFNGGAYGFDERTEEWIGMMEREKEGKSNVGEGKFDQCMNSVRTTRFDGVGGKSTTLGGLHVKSLTDYRPNFKIIVRSNIYFLKNTYGKKP